MARYISVLSEGSYLLESRLSCSKVRRFAKRSSAKARRVLDKELIKKESLIETDPMFNYADWSIGEKIEDLYNGGAIPGCGCGCGGEYLADLIEADKRGISLQELYVALEEEKKQDEVNTMWREYAAAS